MGKQRSDCPLPCSTFFVEKKLLEAFSSEGTYLSLEFSPRQDSIFTIIFYDIYQNILYHFLSILNRVQVHI